MKGLTTLRRKALMAINAKPMTGPDLVEALNIPRQNATSADRVLAWAADMGFARRVLSGPRKRRGPRPYMFVITGEGEHLVELIERGAA